MKHLISTLCILLTALSAPLYAVSNTFIDYQNYNHGYCPDCHCRPCKCDRPHSPTPECPDCYPNGAPPPYPNGLPPPCPRCNPQGLPPPPAYPQTAPPPCPTCNPQGLPPPPQTPPEDCNTCVPPDPCNPSPVKPCECGISLWWIGLGIAGIAAAASIIVTSNNGRTPREPITSN